MDPTQVVTLAVVASYGAVGSLLVVGLLLAPAVAAGHWARRIPGIMLLAAAFGVAAVVVGLLLSWYGGTAAGASIALTAISLAVASAIGASIRRRVSGTGHASATEATRSGPLPRATPLPRSIPLPRPTPPQKVARASN